MKNYTQSYLDFLAKNVCTICKKPATDFEPRFSYFTCDDHANVPPADIHRVRQTYETANAKR